MGKHTVRCKQQSRILHAAAAQHQDLRIDADALAIQGAYVGGFKSRTIRTCVDVRKIRVQQDLDIWSIGRKPVTSEVSGLLDITGASAELPEHRPENRCVQRRAWRRDLELLPETLIILIISHPQIS